MSQFTTSPKLDKLGMRGSNTSEVVFDDVKVPGEISTLRILSIYTCSLRILAVYPQYISGQYTTEYSLVFSAENKMNKGVYV